MNGPTVLCTTCATPSRRRPFRPHARADDIVSTTRASDDSRAADDADEWWRAEHTPHIPRRGELRIEGAVGEKDV